MKKIRPKILILMIIGIVALGMIIERYTNLLGNLSCNSSAIQAKIAQKNLRPVQKCEMQKTNLDTKPAKLVHITYGEGMDCIAGCIYGQYIGLLIDNNVIDVGYEPSTSITSAAEYGDWCDINDKAFDSNKVTKSFTYRNNRYYWIYNFTNYDNKDEIQSLIKEYPQYQAMSNPQYCIINGSIKSLDGENANKENIDFSALTVQLKPLPNYVSPSITDLIKECDNKIIDGSKMERSECLKYIALGNKDPNICKEIQMTDTPIDLAVTQGACIRTVAYDLRDPSICEEIEDIAQKESCYSQLAEKTRNATLCNKISNQNVKAYCIRDANLK